MTLFRYSKTMIEWLRTNANGVRFCALTDRFNRRFNVAVSQLSIRNACKRKGIRNNMPKGTMKGEKLQLLTAEQLAFVAEQYKQMPLKAVVNALLAQHGVALTHQQLKSIVVSQGIRSGRQSQYQVGHTPWSAGTKGVVKRNSGSFKTGEPRHNTLPVGAEIVMRNGYTKTKTAEGWQFKHRIAYEKHHGAIPTGYMVRFLDGNRANFSADNLVLVNMSENRYLNILDLKNTPENLRETALLIARIHAHPNSPRVNVKSEKCRLASLKN